MSPSDRREVRIALAVAIRVTPMVIGRCHPAQVASVEGPTSGRSGSLGPGERVGARSCETRPAALASAIIVPPAVGRSKSRQGPGRAGSILGDAVRARTANGERGSGQASCRVECVWLVGEYDTEGG